MGGSIIFTSHTKKYTYREGRKEEGKGGEGDKIRKDKRLGGGGRGKESRIIPIRSLEQDFSSSSSCCYDIDR